MVLQQKSNVPFWGRGTPGTEVTLHASWGEAGETLVKPDSTWSLTLPSPGAGGPYRLQVGHDDTTLILSNVLVGEVWLCSGQSNMEMSLEGWPPRDTILNGQEEIGQAAFPRIRLFGVKRAFSPVPEPECGGTWTECSPSTVRNFSATGYFFGRKLHEALGVPVGLICASWGGTAVDSWISADFLSRAQQYGGTLKSIRECAGGQHRLLEWLQRYPAIDMRTRSAETRWKNLTCADSGCAARTYDDAEWRVMRLPVRWERTDVGNLDGVVWFRKQITVPREWIGNDLVLELGPIDDVDATFVNGVGIGSHEGEGEWNVDRVYGVPGNLIDSTVVQIAVRVIDYQGGGGICGEPGAMSLHPKASVERIPLAGDWRYVPVAQYVGNMLYVFGPTGQYESRPRLPIDLSANTPTTLYNGMIAPLVPFAIRGAIWYQGEADAGKPAQYRQLFPLLIENWRSDFKRGDFPFYYVQISPYEYGPPTQSQYLREAQLATLSVKNTGMAVTLDIGNPKNIHPANKQDVGDRLARWALTKTYGKGAPYTGPLYTLMRKRKGEIEISFSHAEKGLVLTGGTGGNGFQIAGADRMFRSAAVRVSGSRLIVSRPDLASPEAVRYAFTNTSVATLFNVEGLPASSFRTDNWEEGGVVK
jgi:sialate O-acetylesterase